ncbi:hypothetical protein [Aquimarina algicola]|uniref:Uncharacterized protein n=1 Tax=Aquimarina algicola TaxID=2589995 RepID=A0A504J3F2_9FLAO|nr:hypothetical protein [Aquimarina algicola]TPN82962.1 hypothetical protein FHK87_21285 [Aquimarina algicola]
MKKIISLFLVINTFISCAQKTKDQSKIEKEKYMIPIPEKSKDITKDNFTERVLSEVKHYDKEPVYFIRPIQNNCVYELLINDYPIYKDYGIEKLATPININRAILQSGPQTVTVRLYPLGDALKDAYGEGETITTLLPKTEMKIKVVKYEAFNISDELEDEIVVKEHTSPTKNDSSEFEGAGLPYYEYTFTFNAEVPYKNKGWLNGEDLAKFDKKELEKQVLKCYKNYLSVYKNKDLNNLLKLLYESEIRRRKSQYQNKQKINRVLSELEESLNYENKEFQPIENYETQFYGNGRIIALKHSSKKPVDFRLRGESAFWFTYEDGDDIMAYFPGVYLYLPKGQPLDSLQMIP